LPLAIGMACQDVDEEGGGWSCPILA